MTKIEKIMEQFGTMDKLYEDAKAGKIDYQSYEAGFCKCLDEIGNIINEIQNIINNKNRD